jgi:hypothetical protein
MDKDKFIDTIKRKVNNIKNENVKTSIYEFVKFEIKRKHGDAYNVIMDEQKIDNKKVTVIEPDDQETAKALEFGVRTTAHPKKAIPAWRVVGRILKRSEAEKLDIDFDMNMFKGVVTPKLT